MNILKVLFTVPIMFIPIVFYAQEKPLYRSKEGNSRAHIAIQDFKTLSKRIAFNEDFKYREELRSSKLNNTNFYFGDTLIAKAEVLRNFKRAARKSDNLDGFQQYFLQRKLHYVKMLDRRTLAEIQQTMRSTTLNGYLEILAVFAQRNQIIYGQEGS